MSQNVKYFNEDDVEEIEILKNPVKAGKRLLRKKKKTLIIEDP